MNTNAKKLTVLLLIGACAFSLGACNTMKGIGKDTERAGEKIQKEADRHDDHDRASASDPR
jgi:predicted small secreted protein